MTVTHKSSSRIQVLVIEDNEEHAELLDRLLSGSPEPKFSTCRVSSLSEGLKKLRSFKFDVVLLDLSLPDSQGLATFDTANSVAGNIPIVVLSGIGDVSLAIQTLQRGAQDYLVKGHVDFHLLLRSIQYAVERKHAHLGLKQAHDELEARVRKRTSELSQLNERLKREIADRKRAEEVIRETNEQLLTAMGELRAMQGELIRRERFQALAEMADGIAHEFNNVLAPIVGFADNLLANPALQTGPPAVITNLEKIRAAALAGSKAVMRVRDFARAESGEFAAIPVGDLISNVVMLTEPKWRDEALASGVTISLVPEVGDVPFVFGNAAQLRELLTHLVFNAAKAIVKRGEIRIGAERRGGGVALYVQDNGRGMSEEVRRNCLDPRLHIGVADRRLTAFSVVHAIVARHHGRLEIESEIGRGTKVTVVLPAVTEQPREVPIPEPTSAASVRKGLRILVVDDEPMVREVIQLYLAEDSHSIEMAENGIEALKKFSEGEFDLVLTDRAMPEMSGDQLAAKIKELKPNVPVILLTGFGDLMNADGEKPPGVDAVGAKPFTLNTLRASIAEVRRLLPGYKPEGT